jgi:hypothetical protein
MSAHSQIVPEGLPPVEVRAARFAAALRNLPKPVKRLAFRLTAEQFAELAPMGEADRNVRLGILAHAWEYEQRRRLYWNGGSFLMPMHMETALSREWAEIREDRLAEAQRCFSASAGTVAA